MLYNNYKIIKLTWIISISICVIVQNSMSSTNSYNANAELNYGNSVRDGTEQISFNQIYNVFAQKYFFPYLVGRTSFRYTRLTTQTDSIFNSINSFQPVGELTLNSPWFSFGGFGQRRILENNGSVADFVRDDGGIYFKSNVDKYNLPALGLRYNVGQNFTPKDINIRNNFEERKNADLSYNFYNTSAFYNYNSNTFVNRNADVEHLNSSNRFILNNRYQFFDNRYRVNTNYMLNISSSEYTLPDTLDSQFKLQVRTAYFSVDFSPSQGEMDSLPALIDGNIQSATSDNAYIGLNSRFTNYAVELVQEELVDGIFVYSDSIPFSVGVWEAYYSEDLFFNDEMVWEKIPETQPASYDPDLFRIVIQFDRIEGRFFKLVNISNPDTGAIYITELEVFRSNSGKSDTKQTSSSQTISINNTFQINKQYETNFDVVFQNEPISDYISKKKNDVYFTLTLKQQMTDKISNSIRFQSEHQNFGYIENTTDNRLVNFGTRYAISHEATASFGLTSQWSEIDGSLVQNNKNAIFQFRGKLLHILNFATEFGYSIVTQELYNLENENWNYQISLNGNATKKINGYISYGYKFSRDTKTGKTNQRNTLNFNGNWRITNKIFISTRHIIQNENGVNFSQFANGNWAIMPKLNLGVQVTNFYHEKQFESIRYNFYSNLRVFKKGNLFCRYDLYSSDSFNSSNLNLSTESYSYQVGFRMGI